VCGADSQRLFEAKVLGRHVVRYFHCSACGFLQAQEPHWLAEAYADAINVQDTGLVQRNLEFAEQVAVLLYLFFDRCGKFVDYAGGTGLFTRLMRDIGFDFRTYDPHTANVHARGFEAQPEERGFELVTSFESFEHFVRPAQELDRMLAMSRSVLFSGQLLPGPPPAPGTWWYYGFEHGQHVAFFERRTLERLATERGLALHSVSPILHLMTDRGLAPWKLRTAWRRRRFLLRLVRRNMESRTEADHSLLATRGAAP
jgi:hypothetical protein